MGLLCSMIFACSQGALRNNGYLSILFVTALMPVMI